MRTNITYHAQSVDQSGDTEHIGDLATIEAQLGQLFRRRDWQRRAGQYLRALLSSPNARRNAESLAAAVEDATPRAFQRFLSEAPWDHRPIVNAVQAIVGPLSQSDEGIWVLEEIAFPKQGEHSVGVARQSSTMRTTPQNCQVGVFLAYASPLGQALIDMHLYLPRVWSEDPIRCRQVGVPNSVKYQSKAELALRLLRDARARGNISSQWVIGTGMCGQDVAFRDALDAEGYSYLLEVPGTEPVFHTTEWHTQRLFSLSNHRRRGSGPSLSCPPFAKKIRELATSIPPSEWQYIAAEGAPGDALAVRWTARRVWEVLDGQPSRESWLLLRRARQWGSIIAFLSNAPASIPLETLVRISIAGAAASTALAEVHKKVGLAEYEVRSWPGWHHHMSLCLFLLALLMQYRFNTE